MSTHEANQDTKQSKKIIDGGYQQVYVIKLCKSNDTTLRHVCFLCGEYVYEGYLHFDFLSYDEMSLQYIPMIIPALQRQQDELDFSCESSRVFEESTFGAILQVHKKALEFIVDEVSSPAIIQKIEEITEDWLNHSHGHFLELVANIPSEMDDVQCICSKIYAKGICFIIIYFEGIFYCILQDATEDQPILDVRFPDVSQEGDGVTLGLYNGDVENKSTLVWRKLSLWQCMPSPIVCYSKMISQEEIPMLEKTENLSAPTYQQAYCVLKAPTSFKDNFSERSLSNRDVLFRFGSWCYSGEVELVPDLALDDIPFVLPVLRFHQTDLNFLCDASSMPNDSIFTRPLSQIYNINEVMQSEILLVEDIIRDLMSKSDEYSNQNPKSWLVDVSPNEVFFEFSVVPNASSIFFQSNVELIITKSYHPNGLVSMSLYFDGSYYMFLSDDENKEQSLLDSDFPSVIQGRGHQLKTYPSGLPSWPELRKLSIWQNADATVDSIINNEEDDTMQIQQDEVSKQSVDSNDATYHANTLLSSSDSSFSSHSTANNLDDSSSNSPDKITVKKNGGTIGSPIISDIAGMVATGLTLSNDSCDNNDKSKMNHKKAISNPSDNTYDKKLRARTNLCVLRKPSKLEKHLGGKNVHMNHSKGAPWDKGGRPRASSTNLLDKAV